RADAAEQRDMGATETRTARAMAARLDAMRTSATPGGSRPISDQARERLRSLGYVAAPAGTTTSTEAPNPEAVIADWNAFEQSLPSPVGAVATLARLARAHPAGAVFQATFARALNDSGASTAALAIYRDAVKRWPSDATLYHDLAVAARTAATRASGG